MKKYDFIIVGCGAYGSAISYYLSKSGAKTLTIERFSLNHTNGSSHGKTRIIRTAYAESPIYVPLLKRSWLLWYDLAHCSEQDLIHKTGGLYVGSKESQMVQGVLQSAKAHNLEHQIFDSYEIGEKFRAFRPAREQIGVYEEDAGVLFPERCIESLVKLAKDHGSDFLFEESVISFKEERKGLDVVVVTDQASYAASKVILTAGAWLNSLLAPFALPLKIERQPVFWMSAPKNQAATFSEGNMPVYIFEEEKSRIFYGTPDYGGGVKVGEHHTGAFFDSPELVRREITAEDESRVRSFLSERMPDANGPVSFATTCIYTNSPDGKFLIDKVPGHENAVLVSACSGHGFKFASAIGEAVAAVLLGDHRALDLAQFRLGKLN